MPLEKITIGGATEDGDKIFELNFGRREEKVILFDSFLMAAMVDGFIVCVSISVENYQRF